jgi:hypothetical protein
MAPQAVQPHRATPRSSVVQRKGYSTFNTDLIVSKSQYVVTQVNSGAGFWGHSELFLESWSLGKFGVKTVKTVKIHMQTLGGERIEIKYLDGRADMNRVGEHKSYTATSLQYIQIMNAALTIKRKMKDGSIVYAEYGADRNSNWKTASVHNKAEMSCKSFTDALLIEAGLRTDYGGIFLNAPWDI